jgi:hypothetical protein
MMKTALYRRFLEDRQGGDCRVRCFDAAFMAFLTFFIIEIGVAVLWVGTVEKAAQLGARLAIVSDYAVTGLPASGKNGVANGYAPGQNCTLTNPNPCVPFNSGNPLSCTNQTVGSCNQPGFDAIFNRMDALASMIQPANVTITYTYAGLGFAGGPIVPRVTVTIGRTPSGAGQYVPYDSLTTTVLNGFIRLATGNPSATLGMTNLPVISATFTGEDLSSAGAS